MNTPVAPLLRVLALALLALVACTDPAPPPVDAAHDASDVADASGASADVSIDRAPPRECTQDMACSCFHPEVRGTAPCTPEGRLGPCQCVRAPDGGVPPLPPRLLAPQSVSRVASQRPTLRWQAPATATRLRVELCRDRACARPITSAELGAVSSWRPPAPLPPGIVFWRVRALAGALWQSATWEFQVRHRDAPTAANWLPVKDFDGDSYDDAVVKAAGGYEQWVYHGARGSLPSGERVRLESPDEMELTGFRGGIYDPESGDLNGDGYADLVGSDWGLTDRTAVPVVTIGHVHVFWGGASGLSMMRQQRIRMVPVPELARFPAGEQDYFGTALGVVDFDGDGYSDLAALREPGLAARFENVGYFPRLFLFRGGPGGVSATPDSVFVVSYWLGLGSEVVGVGDVDGDGYGELAGSLYTERGGIFLIYGNPRGDLNERIAYLEIDDTLGALGKQLSTGDDNGDGLSDLIAGGDRLIEVFHGGPRTVLRGDGPRRARWSNVISGHYGASVGVQGDVNGDGYTDLLAGGFCDWMKPELVPGCSRSLVPIYLGGPAGIGREPYVYLSPIAPPELPMDNFVGSLFRSSVSGDLDGDGLDDLLVGDEYARRDVGRAAEGNLRFFPGRTSSAWGAPARTLWGGQTDIQLGMGLY